MKNFLVFFVCLWVVVAAPAVLAEDITSFFPNADFDASTQAYYANGFDYASVYDVPGWHDLYTDGDGAYDMGIEYEGAWWAPYQEYSGFMSVNDGAYLLSSYVIQEGDIFTFSFVGKEWWGGSSQATITLFYGSDPTVNAIGTFVQNVGGSWVLYTDTTGMTATTGSVGQTLGFSIDNTGGSFLCFDECMINALHADDPFLSVSGSPIGTVAGSFTLQAVVVEGSSIVDTNSTILYLDGLPVAGTFDRSSAPTTTVSYVASALPAGVHTGKVEVVGDPVGGLTNEWTFVVHEITTNKLWNINIAGGLGGTARNVRDGVIAVAPAAGSNLWNNIVGRNGMVNSFSLTDANGLNLIGFKTSGSHNWGENTDNGMTVEMFQGWCGANAPMNMASEISGLDPANTYDLYLYSTWTWTENDVTYDITEGYGADVDAKVCSETRSTVANDDPTDYSDCVEGENYVVFRDVIPTEDGRIVFTGVCPDGVMSGLQILEKPSEEGVHILSSAPAGTGHTSPVVLTAEVVDGFSTFDSADLYLDGSPVAIDSTDTAGNFTKIRSVDLTLSPNTTHTGRIVVAGTSPVSYTTNEWTFTIAEQTIALFNEEYSATSLPTNTAVSMSGHSELRLSGSGTPFAGCSISVNDIDSWVFLDNVIPSDAIALLDRITVNGAAAVNNSNVRVAVYKQGSVIIPYPSDFQPLQVYEGENFTGDSVLLSPNQAYPVVLGGKVSSFILKRGYEATLASGSGGAGGVNYVAADGDLKISVLPDGLNDNVRFIRVFAWNWVAKKGTCDRLPWDFNATWFYNWNASWGSDELNWEYVGIKQQPNWPGTPNASTAGGMGMTHFSGYNEPDNSVEDAYNNLTPPGSVSDAVARWPDLESSGLRIGAPAVTDGGYGWIVEFLNQAEAAGRRIDYVPIHYYRASNNNPASAANNLYGFLKAVYDVAHKPIWLTEFNNGANWTGGTDPTFQQNRDCIEAMINMMDSLPWVERYSVYSAVEEPRELFYWDGSGYTPMGEMYRDHVSPIAYQQVILDTGMDPSTSYHFEEGLDDSSGSGNHAVSHNYPEFVPGRNGGKALQFDGIDDHVILPDSVSDCTDFTFAAWVYWKGGAPWQRIFDFGIMDGGKYMFLTPSNTGGSMVFDIRVAGDKVMSTTALPSNVWTHVAVTLSGDTGRLYVNGSQVAINAAMTSNPGDVGAIQHYLGRGLISTHPYFNGMLDDVIIKDEALSGAQIAELASGNQPPQATTNMVEGGTAYADLAYSYSVAGLASDPDGGDVTYSKLYGPSWLDVNPDGWITGTPGNGLANDQYVTVRATDTAGDATSLLLHIVIKEGSAESADLSTSVSGSTNNIAGLPMTLIVTVANHGPLTASNVVVQKFFPAGLMITEASSGGVVDNGVVTWPSIPTLDAGASSNYILTAVSPLPGLYTNSASAGSSTYDPNPLNNSGFSGASVMLTEVVAPDYALGEGSIAVNPQTGLFEQQVTVSNNMTVSAPAFQILVAGLRPGVELYNASGATNGIPYVQVNTSMDPGDSTGVLLEYYVPDRQPFTNALSVVWIVADPAAPVPESGVAVDAIYMDSRDTNAPRFVIEFDTVPGAVYSVLYSSDLAAWYEAVPPVVAGSSRTLWYDDGPPKTHSHPADATNRYYRVFQH